MKKKEKQNRKVTEFHETVGYQMRPVKTVKCFLFTVLKNLI